MPRTMTVEEYRKLATTPKKRRENKYHAKRTEYDGEVYASKAEAEEAQILDDMMARREIREWVRQVPIRLGDLKYTVDFLVIGHRISWCVDRKGVETPRFRTIKRLWKKYGKYDLQVIYRDRSEEIIEGGQAK